MLIPTPAFLQQIMANAVATTPPTGGGILSGLKLGLSTVALAENVNLVLGTDVVSPLYAGYADQLCPFGAPFMGDDGNWSSAGPLLTFQPAADPVTPDTVMAYCLYLPGTTPVIYAVENLAVPKVLGHAYDAFKLVPEVSLVLANMGSADIVN